MVHETGERPGVLWFCLRHSLKIQWENGSNNVTIQAIKHAKLKFFWMKKISQSQEQEPFCQ
jgi:hypothetical protein